MELSSLNAVKTRARRPAQKEGAASELLLEHCCRKERKHHPNKLYDVEVVEDDPDQERVKIHYIGYGTEYEEWKSKSEIVICPPSRDSSTSPDVSPFSTLACCIKRKLLPNREDPAIRIQTPFDKENWKLLEEKAANTGRDLHLGAYSDLDELLGENWHYRVCNERGDFSYVILETVRYHIYTPRPLLEYSVSTESDGKLKYTPVYIEQGPELVFSFVRGDGNHVKLAKFLS